MKAKRKQSVFDVSLFLPLKRTVEFLAPHPLSTCVDRLQNQLPALIHKSSVYILSTNRDSHQFRIDENLDGQLERWDEQSTLVTLMLHINAWMLLMWTLGGTLFAFSSLLYLISGSRDFLLSLSILGIFGSIWILYVIERNNLARAIFNLLNEQ